MNERDRPNLRATLPGRSGRLDLSRFSTQITASAKKAFHNSLGRTRRVLEQVGGGQLTPTMPEFGRFCSGCQYGRPRLYQRGNRRPSSATPAWRPVARKLETKSRTTAPTATVLAASAQGKSVDELVGEALLNALSNNALSNN